MSGKILARASAVSLALILAACGGDEGSTSLGGTGNGENGGGSTETANVGSIELLANPINIQTADGSTSSITARVVNSQGVLMEGVPLEFAATNNGTLQVPETETNESGVVTATLTSSDKRNRTVTVTAKAGNVTGELDIDVSGTVLSISGPSSIAFGRSASFEAELRDSNGTGIAGQPIEVSTTLGEVSSTNLTTASDGTVSFDLAGGNVGGTATITASAFDGDSELTQSQGVTISGDDFVISQPAAGTEVELGDSQTVTLSWDQDGSSVADGTEVQFSATRGTMAPAHGVVTTSGGTASVAISSTNSGFSTITATDPDTGLSASVQIEFIATTPHDLNLQASKSQLSLGESTEVFATVRDADNNLVKNQNVSFQIVEDTSEGTLSKSTDMTDSQGRASTTYTAGSTGSGRDGVEIFASVGSSVSNTINLTVARQALRLALGTGNELEEPDTVRYRKHYLVIVTDANGAPIENAEIELSVLPTRYRKGFYTPNTDDEWTSVTSTFCEAEDRNGNGQLDTDPDEDDNNNGKLDPTNSATTSAAAITSAADGSGDFSLLYPQSHCGWVEVDLTATVRVDGTESTETSRFFLECLADDLNDIGISPPGGVESLYGSEGDCSNPD